MKATLLLTVLLLAASGPLSAHPITLTDSVELPYSGPVSVEDGLGLDELSFSEQTGPGQRYSSLMSGELSRDGLRTAGLLPKQMKREVLLERQSLLNPFSHFLGVRKQFRKRGNTECFWKYCV